MGERGAKVVNYSVTRLQAGDITMSTGTFYTTEGWGCTELRHQEPCGAECGVGELGRGL